jgi:hypothetical protein
MLIVAMIFSASTIFAESPRLVLVEELTNASCGPCATYNPAFHTYIIDNLDKMVPIIYHPWYPGKDVMYDDNTTMHRGRTEYYGTPGVPNAVVNGSWDENPGNLQDVKDKINEYAGTMSPITITIDETVDGNNVDFSVTVATDEDLTGMRLRVAAVEFYHYYDDAGNNGEVDFPFIAREMFPSHDGQALSVTAGNEVSFDYDYTIDSEWNADQMYLVAWVQDDDSDNEVLQAATTLETIRSKITYAGSYLTIPAADKTTETITIENPNDKEVDIAVRINESKSVMPDDFTIELSENNFTLPAGGTKDVDVNITTSDQAGFIIVNVEAVPENTEEIPILQDVNIYAMTDNAENVIYVGTNNAVGFEYNSFTAIDKYSQKTVALPLNTTVMTAYPSGNFERAIFSMDYFNRGNIGAQTSMNQMVMSSINTMLSTGKKVLICASIEQTFIDGQYASSMGKSFFDNTLAIEATSNPEIRVTTNQQGQITGVKQFPCDGVNGHEIGDDFDITMNQFNQSTHPFYVIYTEQFEPTSESNAEKFLYYDNDPESGAGFNLIRGESKLVYLSFTFKAIADQATRDLLMERIWTWLDKEVVEEGPSISLNTTSLDFGEVEIGNTAEENLIISNEGNKELVVSGAEFFWNDDDVYSFVDKPNMPLRIDPQTMDTLKIAFAPEEAKTYDTPGIDIESNDPNSAVTSIMLMGIGVQPGSGPTISAADQIDFGEVMVGSKTNKITEIENIGDEALVITDIFIADDEDNVFSLGTLPQFPISLEPGDPQQLVVEFEPGEQKTYDMSSIQIESNDESNETLNIPLLGVGSPNSVEDGTADGFAMTAGPNPFESATKISYNLTKPQFVEIRVVDARGGVIANLDSGFKNTGEYEVDFDASSFSQGTYYVVAKVGGQTARLPIVLVR